MILSKEHFGVKISVAIVACLILGGGLFGWGYWLGQRSMQSKVKTLEAQVAGVRPTPGNPWSSPNAMHPPMPQAGANLPANATPEMKEFLENRAKLVANMSQLRQQNPNGPNGAPDPKIMAQFQEQNKDLLARQRELAQKISEQQMKNPLPEPSPLQIPPNATPQMKSYLTDRDALMRDQVAFMNQHRTDEPSKRQAEMQQWRQQNASRFQQLQQEAQAMAQNNATAPNPNTTTTK